MDGLLSDRNLAVARAVAEFAAESTASSAQLALAWPSLDSAR
jgi:aryl-alcohol dehydrogenase-like predicted oxidoreductase